jgi:hypothetical protein
MLYRKTILLLGAILVFSSSLIPQVSIAKLNISPEPERIELNDRLDRCKEKGFVVNQSLNAEKALRKLVKDCEGRLHIRYPARSQLLAQVEVCVQNGYKSKIPRSLTLVKLNDLAYNCQINGEANRNRSDTWLVILIVIFILVFVFMVILFAAHSNPDDMESNALIIEELDSDQLLFEQHERISQIMDVIDYMSDSNFEYILNEEFKSSEWFVSQKIRLNDSEWYVIAFKEDHSESVAIQVVISNTEVDYDVVQQAYEFRKNDRTKYAWIVTNSRFSGRAEAIAKELNVDLYDRDYITNFIFNRIQ